METLYLDTHVMVWLFAGEIDRLSERAVDLIEERHLLTSPMAVLELEYLYEIGRLRYDSDAIMASLTESIDLQVCLIPFESVVQESLKQSWTRDPFDRIIVTNTLCAESHLLTMDRKIHAHFDRALW